jgi:trehalose 6-phosphate synthase
MKAEKQIPDNESLCGNDLESMLNGRSLIVVSNRGPIGFSYAEDGNVQIQRSGGGLVTALLGLAQNVNITWVASALNDLEKEWGHERLDLDEGGRPIDLHLVPLEQEVYESYYNVISNPLLWFLQHSMWDFVSGPTFTRETWQAWEEGYVAANRLFAQAVAKDVRASSGRSLVMLQDYHLYLLPRILRSILRQTRKSEQLTLTHFVHIPWPGPEEIRILPPKIRNAILDGLTAVDVLGFQTREDGINFLQTIEAHLLGAYVSYKHGRIWYRNHATYVRDFPISIDVIALKNLAQSQEVLKQRIQLEEIIKDEQLILRVDRTDPSKNIVRGFQAFGEMLELHPEHRGKVKFIALLVPSRLDVDEYHSYLDNLMAAAGWVNSKYGTSEWEPVRIILGENYQRAVAALQLYDVLLVNSIADGMNLVAKEGPVVNQKDGVLVLSERTGARQQLEPGALVISPCDVYATSEALHQALTMPAEERQTRANRLRTLVEENDINVWFCSQISEISRLGF